MKHVFFLVALCCVAQIVLAGLNRPVARITGGLPPDAIVIGPGADSLVITRDTTITGSFYVAGAAKLVVRNARLTLNGDINVFDSARVSFTGGALVFAQDYVYQRSIGATATSYVSFDHTEIRITNGNANANVGEHARWHFNAVTFTDNFFTMGVAGNGTLTVDSCPIAGEYLFTQSSTSTFTNSGFILAWQWIDRGQVVDETFPDSTVTHWAFPDSARTATGIGYRVVFNKCKTVMWTLIHSTGAKLTIHDSHVRALGVMFTGADSVALTGIANGSHYDDVLFPDTTRTLRLINTTVDTWNYYPFEKSRLSLTNCFYGELLAAGWSHAYVNTSVCDGTGGYFSATDSAKVTAVSSTFRCAIVSRMRSVVNIINSDIEPFVGGDQLLAERAGSLGLLNTRFTAVPRAFDTAVVVALGVLPPARVGPNQLVDLQGSASIISGPHAVVKFVSYSLSAAPVAGGATTWIRGHATTPVVSGSLGTWRVPPTADGLWNIRLAMTHNFGDSIALGNTLMVDPTLTSVGEQFVAEAFRVFPSPATRELSIYGVDPAITQRVDICDMLGRTIRTQRCDGHSLTINLDGLTRGEYFVRAIGGWRSPIRFFTKY